MSESRAILKDGRVLTAETERIETTSLGPRPDPSWSFTDTQGHDHHWDDGYPTLTWVQDQEDYTVVEDGELESYPGWGHYECSICGEEIRPAQRGPSPFRSFMPAATRYCLDGEPITEDEARALLSHENDGTPTPPLTSEDAC